MGSDGLAALNFSIVLYTVLQATGLMLGIGAATEFQVCSARGDRTGANRVFTTALVMAGVAAAVLLAVVEAFATPLASLLGADEATLPLTVTYLRTIFAFAPLFLLNNVLLPFVRNDGSPQLAMVAMLVGSFGNIVLDALFIFGFGWGMFGAAFATGFAPIMSMAVLLAHFFMKRNTFRPVRLHLRARLVGHIAALGFSSFVVELSGGLVLLVLNLVILAFEGTIGVAAYGVVANFAFVASALFVGIAQGIQPLASNAYARGSDRDVRAVLRLALRDGSRHRGDDVRGGGARRRAACARVQSRQRSAAHGACRGRHARVLPRVLLRGGEYRRGCVLQRGGEASVWPGYLHRARSSGHAGVRGRAGGAVRHGRRVGHVPRGRGGHVRADRRASRAVRARAAPARSGGGRVSPRQRAVRGRASASRPVAPVEPVELVVDGLVVRLTRKRIKNLNLRVHRGGGFVEVSAPAYVRDRDIERFVREKRPWIDAKLAQVAASPAAVAAEAGPEEVAAWRAVVEACVPALVEAWEPIMGVKAGKLAYRNMTSRWGSCQPATGRICINVRLALYPPECLEYVVVHELCHLLERGHGSRFKALMDAFMPDWRDRRAKLR